jgi:hypothetical protein
MDDAKPRFILQFVKTSASRLGEMPGARQESADDPEHVLFHL